MFPHAPLTTDDWPAKHDHGDICYMMRNTRSKHNYLGITKSLLLVSVPSCSIQNINELLSMLPRVVHKFSCCRVKFLSTLIQAGVCNH